MQNLKLLLKPAYIIASLIVIAVLSYFIFPGIREVFNKKKGYIKDNPSIAVLPFVNTGNDPEQQYFSDGLTEEVLNSLSHLKGLKVSARTSSFTFKGKNINVKEVGKKLGVHTVLEGSFQL